MTIKFAKILVPVFVCCIAFGFSGCQNEKAQEKPNRNLPGLGIPRGLISKTPQATPGYVLFNPLISDTTYLINIDGLVVKTWKSEYGPTGWMYLKDNGNLARGGRDPENTIFAGGGQGGWLQEFSWNGELVWEYKFSSSKYMAHHDVAIMPNGNYLTIAWESKTLEEAIAAGRDPKKIPVAGLWPDWVAEINPIGKDSAVVV